MEVNDYLKELTDLVGRAEKDLDEPELMFFLSQAIHYLSTANAFRIALRRSGSNDNNTIEGASKR